MASKTTDLKIDVRESASWSRRLSITVPAERVRRTRGRVAEQAASRLRLPGFRKGKVPTRVVEQQFGPSIDQETIDRLIQEAYREALDAEGITPVAQGKVDEIKYDREAEMSFEVEVEVRPEIQLARLVGFNARRPSVEVSAADAEAVLERLRDERATWVPLEQGVRPGVGDQVLVEITAFDPEGEAVEHARSYRIIIGDEQAIPDVESAIMTLAEGEAGEFDVAFPEDFPDENRRGQHQKLRIEAKEAKKKELPVLDDAFAAAIGEFASLEELRKRVETDLQEDAVQRAESEVRRQLIDRILEANPFDPPPSMVERYLDYMLGDIDDPKKKKRERSPEEEERMAELRVGLRPQALWSLKRSLVVERVAEQEGLRATQDEIDSKVEEIATRRDRSPSEIWIQLEKSGQLETLEREITEEKVFEFLKSQNTIA
jgi:trigger factor